LRDQPDITQYSAYMWDLTTMIPGIPILGIMIRYNLLSGNVCGPFWSFFFGVVFPWIVTAFCYEQDVLTTLCNWVAIICSGYVNFVVPAMLYYTALERYPDKMCPWGELPDFTPARKRSRNHSTSVAALLNGDDDDDDAILGSSLNASWSKASAKSFFSIGAKSSKDSIEDGADPDETKQLMPINPDTGKAEVEKVYTPVCAVPKSVKILCWRIKVNRAKVAVFLGVFFAVMSTLSIFLSIWSTATDGGADPAPTHHRNHSNHTAEAVTNMYRPAYQKDRGLQLGGGGVGGSNGGSGHWREAEDVDVFGPDWM